MNNAENLPTDNNNKSCLLINIKWSYIYQGGINYGSTA